MLRLTFVSSCAGWADSLPLVPFAPRFAAAYPHQLGRGQHDAHSAFDNLRCTYAGRAQFSMQLEKYEVVPPQIQQKIVAEKAVA